MVYMVRRQHKWWWYVVCIPYDVSTNGTVRSQHKWYGTKSTQMVRNDVNSSCVYVTTSTQMVRYDANTSGVYSTTSTQMLCIRYDINTNGTVRSHKWYVYGMTSTQTVRYDLNTQMVPYDVNKNGTVRGQRKWYGTTSTQVLQCIWYDVNTTKMVHTVWSHNNWYIRYDANSTVVLRKTNKQTNKAVRSCFSSILIFAILAWQFDRAFHGVVVYQVWHIWPQRLYVRTWY